MYDLLKYTSVEGLCQFDFIQAPKLQATALSLLRTTLDDAILYFENFQISDLLVGLSFRLLSSGYYWPWRVSK